MEEISIIITIVSIVITIIGFFITNKNIVKVNQKIDSGDNSENSQIGKITFK